jgi:hypothetical protein
MKPNFEPTLQYRSDGRWLEVCGDLNWAIPPPPKNQDAQKVRITATVIQDDTVIAHGTSQDEFVRGEPEWMFHIRPDAGGKFTQKPAQASGVMIVTDPPGLPGFAWTMQVMLQPAPKPGPP